MILPISRFFLSVSFERVAISAVAFTVLTTAPASAAFLGVFTDPAFVMNRERTNTLAILDGVYDFRTFGNTEAEWLNATNNDSILVILDQDIDPLFPALTAASRSAITTFVNNGGGILFLGASDTAQSSLNGLFGFNLQFNLNRFSSNLNPLGTIGTEYEGGPNSLPALNAVTGFGTDSLPAGALSAYRNFSLNYTTGFTASFGSGNVAYLGYDWFESAFGNAGSWVDVFDRTIKRIAPTVVPTVPEGSMAIPALALVRGSGGKSSTRTTR